MLDFPLHGLYLRDVLYLNIVQLGGWPVLDEDQWVEKNWEVFPFGLIFFFFYRCNNILRDKG